MDRVRVSGEDFRGEDARGDIALVRDALHAQVLLVVHELPERRVAHLAWGRLGSGSGSKFRVRVRVRVRG